MYGAIAGAAINSAVAIHEGRKTRAGMAATNASQIQMAERQMNFQKDMSSSAHQREVIDLKAAGLNPILSAGAGASSPGGSMANLQNPDASRVETARNVADNINRSFENKQKIAMTKNIKEQTNSVKADIVNKKLTAKTIQAGLGKKEVQGYLWNKGSEIINQMENSAKSWYQNWSKKSPKSKPSKPIKTKKLFESYKRKYK